MGARHLALGWSNTLWTHMWIDHMFAYLCRWGTLATFNCFAFQGSHLRLKRLLWNCGWLVSGTISEAFKVWWTTTRWMITSARSVGR